jgi:hypothetical protein
VSYGTGPRQGVVRPFPTLAVTSVCVYFCRSAAQARVPVSCWRGVRGWPPGRGEPRGSAGLGRRGTGTVRRHRCNHE